VFENRVLRRVFEIKREEVAAGWRMLKNEMLHNLYADTNITRAIESMRWTGNVACMGKMNLSCRFSTVSDFPLIQSSLPPQKDK
jgi:hypothetical protein